MEIMKYDRKEFDIEYANAKHSGKIPFAEIFENNPICKEYLYDDFCKSEPKPNSRLYMRKYFTDEEVQKGLKEANDRIPIIENYNNSVPIAATSMFPTAFESKLSDIEREFRSLDYEGTLDKKYFLPFILETKIVKTLVLLIKYIFFIFAAKKKS